MKTKTIDRILFFVVLIVAGLLILVPMAHATQADPASSVANSTASAKAGASSKSSSALDLSLMNSPSMRGGNSYSVMSGGAAPLPGGLCPKGDTRYVKVFWGLLETDFSTTRTEMECLDKVLAMLRDTAPKPAIINYVSPVPEPSLPANAPARASDPTPAALVCDQKPPKPAPKKHVKAPKVCK